MMPTLQQTTYWVNIPERASWLVVNVEGKKLGVVLSVSEGGKAYLTVAGYHAGEARFVGERHNILSVKVEPIPKTLHDTFVTLIHNALPTELQGLPVTFL